MTHADLKSALSGKGTVEVDAQVTVTVNGTRYVWDKETALQIADGIAKSYGLRLEKDLPTIWPSTYAVPGLKEIPCPAKITYGTGTASDVISFGVGGQADQVCAAENKKYKERS